MKKSIITLIALLSLPALAVPDVVTYAARVENNQGPFSGTASVTFQIFDASVAGTQLWTETVASLLIIGGDLVHDLGSVSPLDDTVLSRDAVFLQVSINGETVEPRAAIRAVPFALRSRFAEAAQQAANATNAQQLNGQPASAFTFSAANGGGLEANSNAFSIASGGITTAMIGNSQVTAAKLGASAVVENTIGASAVTNSKIADNAITNAKIASGAVNSASIADGSVTGTDIANGTITSDDLGSSSVTNAKIAANAITLDKISGAEVSLFRVLNICDGDRPLTITNVCTTRTCGFTGVNTPIFFRCDGTCVAAQTSAQTNCSNELVGRLLAP